MKPIILSLIVLVLSSGCANTSAQRKLDATTVQKPQDWFTSTGEITDQASSLTSWWTHFNDPTLNSLVQLTLKQSPDLLNAQAKLKEVQALYGVQKAALFPQLNLSATAQREKDLTQNHTNSHQSGLEASWDIDLFGRNRFRTASAKNNIISTEYNVHSTALSLIAATCQSYIDYRAFYKQQVIAQNNLSIQQQTLDLVKQRFSLGESPQLDVERSENLVHTTASLIPEFQRQADFAFFRLSVLTGQLPEQLALMLKATSTTIPHAHVHPLLDTPANILEQRPDVQQAKYLLLSQTKLTQSAWSDIFPSFTLGGFFGLAETSLLPSETVWSGTLKAALSLLNFGRIRSQIKASQARELQAFEFFRKITLEAIADVETSLSNVISLQHKQSSLDRAHQHAQEALKLSQKLYSEGEISFLNILDAQRSVNEADSTYISAQADHAKATVKLFASLGVY